MRIYLSVSPCLFCTHTHEIKINARFKKKQLPFYRLLGFLNVNLGSLILNQSEADVVRLLNIK